MEQVNANDHISWIEGVIRFRDRPLSSVLTYLSRYYGVPIEAHDTAGITITGSLILFDELNTILRNLTVIAPVSFYVDGDKTVKKTNPSPMKKNEL